MKILYKRLALIFTVAILLLTSIFTISLYERRRDETEQYLNQLLDSVERNIDRVYEEEEEYESLLQEDYLNRALAAEYIISGDAEMISAEGLAILKELMKAGQITVIGHGGEILVSTDPEIGQTYGDRAELDQLLRSGGNPAYEIHIDQPDAFERPSYFYVLVSSASEQFAALRLDVDLEQTVLESEKERIESVLKQATTEYETSIIAVGMEKGRLLGITENNLQQFEIDAVESRTELVEFLQMLEEDRLEVHRVNGELQGTVVRSAKGLYLVAFTTLNRVIGQAAWTFLEGVAGTGIIGVLTILIVRYQLTRMERQLSAARTQAAADHLTGLYNRSGFEQKAREFLAQDHPKGVMILFDLDNFKRINDSEGHPEGDHILKRFAECLREEFRATDLIGRLGGDEFIVLIPNEISEKLLGRKFQELLKHVRSVVGVYYEKYDTSVSIGAVPVDGSVKAYEELYQCADTALYIAKYLGKDRYYINSRKISCMKEECIRCRKDCPRSRLLNLKNREE